MRKLLIAPLAVAFAKRIALLALATFAQCADGVDNDGDGRIDYPADRQCLNAQDDSEKRR